MEKKVITEMTASGHVFIRQVNTYRRIDGSKRDYSPYPGTYLAVGRWSYLEDVYKSIPAMQTIIYCTRYGHAKYLKVTNLEENHNGLQYHTGLVEDIIHSKEKGHV
jgi:hypothetical protein